MSEIDSSTKTQLQNNKGSVLRGLKILLVEDNELNQTTTSALLGRFGAFVSVASNGKEAVEKVCSEQFDLVLMDMQMPIMNGIEAAKAIRQLPEYASLIIVAMTAALNDEEQDCIDAGMNGFLSKPVALNQLFEMVAGLIGGQQEEVIFSDTTLDCSIDTQKDDLFFDDGVLNTAKTLSFFADDRALASRFIEKFIENNSDAVERLELLIKNNDLDSAVLLVHSIKGNSGYLGAAKLVEICTQLEKELGKLQNDTLLEEFKAEIAKVLASAKSRFPQKQHEEFVLQVADTDKLLEIRTILDSMIALSSKRMYISESVISSFKNSVRPFVSLELSEAVLENIENFNHKLTTESLENIITMLWPS